MPIYRLMQAAAFDAAAVKIITTAFDDAIKELGLVGRTDPKAELVARKIIESARMGERDPVRLRELATAACAPPQPNDTHTNHAATARLAATAPTPTIITGSRHDFSQIRTMPPKSPPE